ncbi:hypothetical protein Undi14_11820 [Undibacterium sp. 14-3-2]|uniref:hypothetical protein n=1 Tax=Undibacterium sp. 14-3-2 TaxID=2800129 RepID=UPI0019044A9D|nr:hypothetical protein [Undibacterium sp. 14-3-2]MBK1890721.1 hypothetical protein [Undibacterium sp. 14-3-2]
MTTSTPKSLHIFRHGNQTAMSGVTLMFSESEMVERALACNPAKSDYSIIIAPRGHVPLIPSNECLSAESHQAAAEFLPLMEVGRYKRIAASFYRPVTASIGNCIAWETATVASDLILIMHGI